MLVQICHFERCATKVPTELSDEGLCLEHYLEDAFMKLATASERLRLTQEVDSETAQWMLSQLDLSADLLARQNTVENNELRCRLIELLLGVANLIEHIRHCALKIPTGS